MLVQDYHFALAPRAIRQRVPASTIVSSWHIPWPSPRRFAECRWARELLDGLLGSDILGFQTDIDCRNCLHTIALLLDAEVDLARRTVAYQTVNGRSGVPGRCRLEWRRGSHHAGSCDMP